MRPLCVFGDPQDPKAPEGKHGPPRRDRASPLCVWGSSGPQGHRGEARSPQEGPCVPSVCLGILKDRTTRRRYLGVVLELQVPALRWCFGGTVIGDTPGDTRVSSGSLCAPAGGALAEQ